METDDFDTYDEEEYRQLEERYRASAIARGLSLKQISTILNNLRDTAERGGYLKSKALQDLLKSSPMGAEQKEVSWSNPTTSHAFAGREGRYRPGETRSPVRRGILRRQSTYEDRHMGEGIGYHPGSAPVRERDRERALEEVIVRDEVRERPRSPPPHRRKRDREVVREEILIRRNKASRSRTPPRTRVREWEVDGGEILIRRDKTEVDRRLAPREYESEQEEI